MISQCIEEIPSKAFKRLVIETDEIKASDLELLINSMHESKTTELFGVVTCKVLEIELTLNEGTIKVLQRDEIKMKFDKFRTHTSLELSLKSLRMWSSSTQKNWHPHTFDAVFLNPNLSI